MTRRAKQALQAVPLLQHDPVFLGIDVGKTRHVAGFVSKTLLERHQRFEACPALAFEKSREGFQALVERMRTLAPLEHDTVLLEKTNHYHKALQQFLQELDVPVYVMHVQERLSGMLKTDKRDALSLANTLYNQFALGVQVADKAQLVRRAVPPSGAAAQLKGLIRHRDALVREATQRKNKLVAICDEVFPELVQILKDPNLPAALAIRERFPTPATLVTASLSALQEVRGKTRFLADAKLLELQRLATTSIGTKDVLRQRGLLIEQTQLIRELRLLQEHIARLEKGILFPPRACEDLHDVRSVCSLRSGKQMGKMMNSTERDESNNPKNMRADAVVHLLQLFEQQGIKVVVDGGWGVDALLERQTRVHADVDIAVSHTDVPKLRALLTARGYKDVPHQGTWECNFVMGDEQGHEVDIHSYLVDAQGTLVFGVAYPLDSLTGMGTIQGVPVPCISAEWTVKFHSGYELDENDYRDVSAVCRQFGIPLPDEYERFIRDSAE